MFEEANDVLTQTRVDLGPPGRVSLQGEVLDINHLRRERKIRWTYVFDVRPIVLDLELSIHTFGAVTRLADPTAMRRKPG